MKKSLLSALAIFLTSPAFAAADQMSVQCAGNDLQLAGNVVVSQRYIPAPFNRSSYVRTDVSGAALMNGQRLQAVSLTRMDPLATLTFESSVRRRMPRSSRHAPGTESYDHVTTTLVLNIDTNNPAQSTYVLRSVSHASTGMIQCSIE